MRKRLAGTGATPPTPGQLIHVSWEDCFTVDRWSSVATLLKETPPLMETVGYFLGTIEGKTGPHWILSTGLQNESGETVFYGCNWFIPQMMVLSWRAL